MHGACMTGIVSEVLCVRVVLTILFPLFYFIFFITKINGIWMLCNSIESVWADGSAVDMHRVPVAGLMERWAGEMTRAALLSAEEHLVAAIRNVLACVRDAFGHS